MQQIEARRQAGRLAGRQGGKASVYWECCLLIICKQAQKHTEKCCKFEIKHTNTLRVSQRVSVLSDPIRARTSQSLFVFTVSFLGPNMSIMIDTCKLCICTQRGIWSRNHHHHRCRRRSVYSVSKRKLAIGWVSSAWSAQFSSIGGS